MIFKSSPTTMFLVVAVGMLALQSTFAAKIKYTIYVKTSNSIWSGTDENMAYQFIGDNDGTQVISESVTYYGSWSMFERGSYDKVEVMAEDVKTLTSIQVKLKNAGTGYIDQWTLDYIELTLHGVKYVANFYKTFKRNNQYFYPDSMTIQSCPIGYEPKPDAVTGAQHCVDRDECLTVCNTMGETCTNTPGSYLCTCQAGFSRVGSECVDNNECLDSRTYHCPNSHTVCVNTVGSYKCSCTTGFEEKLGACVDRDECQNYAEHRCEQKCVNNVGSYTCACDAGFQIGPDGKKCTDLNECATQNQCDSVTSVCYDERGSFRCQCRPGYKNPIGNNKVCNKISCSALNYLADKNIVINPPTCSTSGTRFYGDKCHFTCKAGYYLDVRTSVEYVCTADGYWKGIYPPHCLPKLCPALSVPENGFYIPSGCGVQGTQHNKKCSLYCNSGYELIGDKDYACAFEKYDKDPANSKCVKTPYIRCPADVALTLQDMETAAPIGNMYKSHTSNMLPSQVTSIPANMGPSHEFGVGVHLVQFIATNTVGHTATCSYRVSVVDASPPRAEFCPDDLYITTTKSQVNATWIDPRFVDNLAVVTVASTVENGKLHSPTSFQVLYTAKDARNLEAKCAFSVNIKSLKCHFQDFTGGDQIINQNCFTWGPGESSGICNAQCTTGKTFDTVDPKNALKSSWPCTNSVLQDSQKQPLERVPDCVDYISKQAGQDCPSGHKVTLNYREFVAVEVCGKCPRGTKYMPLTKDCAPCPKGTYNDKEGELSCTPCDQGTTTTEQRCIAKSACKALCSPGSFSRSGFNDASGCQSCPLNHYQDNHGAVACKECPVGSKTLATGNAQLTDCLRAPVIIHIKPSAAIDVSEGDDVTFDCTSDGVPEPFLTWQKLTTDVPAAHEIGLHSINVYRSPGGVKYLRYTIKGVKVKDSGNYRCKAENSQGNVKGSTTLTVSAGTGSGSLLG